MEIHHHLFVSLLFLLLFPLCSSQENTRSLAIDVDHPLQTSPISEKLSPKLVYEIKVHGLMLWASMGVLIPIGIISIRLMSTKDQSLITLRRLFYLHVISQMVAVILVTIGAIMSIKNFNNSFSNHHQRLGIGLYVIVWFQAVLGFLRPSRGGKARRNWFVGHWIIGTSIAILGIINIYTGLHAFTPKRHQQVLSFGPYSSRHNSLPLYFSIFFKTSGLISKAKLPSTGTRPLITTATSQP